MNMNLVPAMWIAWGIATLATAGLYVYRTAISQNEEGQIFLDEAFSHEQTVQREIVRRVNRVEPALRASLIVTGVMTAVVIAYCVWYVVNQLFG